MFIQANTANWQVSITDPSVIIEDASDIAQCIYTILATAKGTDPLRPTFGSDVFEYIDKPANIAQPSLIYECYRAIEQWEPRVYVRSVRILNAGIERRAIQIDAIIIASSAQVEMTFNF